MSKKAKKGGPSSNFKLVPKIDSEAELVQELHLKKKYLEEKYRKHSPELFDPLFFRLKNLLIN